MVIDVDINSDLANIEASPTQISGLILNLIDNARESMQEKGYLRIKAENHYLDNQVVGYNKVIARQYVKLTISDSGTGIPSEIIDRIFDPYFSTKTVHKKRGSGLGLSVVHAIVKDHNVYVDVESTVGKGTSFIIYFPIATENSDITAETLKWGN